MRRDHWEAGFCWLLLGYRDHPRFAGMTCGWEVWSRGSLLRQSPALFLSSVQITEMARSTQCVRCFQPESLKTISLSLLFNSGVIAGKPRSRPRRLKRMSVAQLSNDESGLADRRRAISQQFV